MSGFCEKGIAPMRLVRFTLLALFVAVAPLAADPITVQVLSAQYKTSLSVNAEHRTYNPPDVGGYVATPITIARTNTSTAPTADTIAFGGPETWAHGTADPFRVLATTDTTDLTFEYYGRADALAESIIHFTPTQTSIAEIGLEASAFDQWRYTNGGASLLDLTTGTQLWDYSWAYRNGPSSMPWDVVNGSMASAAFITPTELTAGHVYVLSLLAHSNSAQDSQGASIAISGLRSTPEPSTLALLLTGAVGFGVRKMRQRRA